MGELPTLPLDEPTRKTLAFCLLFQTRRGFFRVYEQQLALIWGSSRKKRGLKSKAYEQTEVLYEQFFQRGRCFPDRENFFDAYSKRAGEKVVKVR
ncbi:hypothetical protein [Spirosoma endbachense]|uniref:Uncharacterized protein n=1 Tax=Spirosoma endbachense TaxID=2666025 RepID=A0A6P1W664_9BACT|nr:hypothetical protein [Spirosoma endbachense]QHV99216.1 hypothetical protein GJR95_31255 [Spirosoma endbachense]